MEALHFFLSVMKSLESAGAKWNLSGQEKFSCN